MHDFHVPKIHIRKNGRIFGFGVSPNADWKIVFVVISLLCFLALMCGLYFFFEIYRGTLFGGSANEPVAVKSLNVAKLQNIVRIYEEREQRSNLILNGAPDIADPSL